MSFIASFWTLDAGYRAGLVDAFRPIQRLQTKRRWLVLSSTVVETVYPWFEYMNAHAREEAEFQFSGAVMADLELMLPQGSSLFSLALPESNKLAEYAEASVALVDEERARAAESLLSSFELTQEAVIRFYESDQRPLENPADAESLLAGLAQLVAWCRTVTPGRLGLLMIG